MGTLFGEQFTHHAHIRRYVVRGKVAVTRPELATRATESGRK